MALKWVLMRFKFGEPNKEGGVNEGEGLMHLLHCFFLFSYYHHSFSFNTSTIHTNHQHLKNCYLFKLIIPDFHQVSLILVNHCSCLKCLKIRTCTRTKINQIQFGSKVDIPISLEMQWLYILEVDVKILRFKIGLHSNA